jgi:predicted heme/steroid binding protein
MRSRAIGLVTVGVVALLLVCLPVLAGCGQSSLATSASGPPTTTSGGGAALSGGGTGLTGSGTPASGGSQSSSTAQGKTFTLDQLATFNGTNGTPAYVAVDGVVYDVTNSAYWKSGTHSTCNLGATAGEDLSELIKQAPPRMRSDLQRMPVVGSLVK